MSKLVSRRAGLAVASVALTAALITAPALAANAEGWRNFTNPSCGSQKVETYSWSTGITEHFQRTVGGAETMKSWDNQWVAQVRRGNFGYSTLSFAQVWTDLAMINGDWSCV